jgi:hypothetical protein
MVGPRWNLEAEGPCFSSAGALKTYTNLWEGGTQVIPIQQLINGEGHGWSPGQVRAVPEPGHGQSEM